jgi:hypothetical protein
MAGTLVISTLSDGSNSTSATNPIRGSAKAWVLFDGANAFSPNPSTTAIRASYNVSSITKSSSGNFLVNFTNVFANANYSVSGAVGQTGTANACFFCGDLTQTQTASQYQVIVRNYVASLVDASFISAQFYQ